MVHTWTSETIYKLSSDAECPERSDSWVIPDDSSNPGSVPLLARSVASHAILSFSGPHFSIWKMQMDKVYLKKLLWRIKKTKAIRDYVDSYYRKLGMTQNSLPHVLVYGRSPSCKWLIVSLIFVLPTSSIYQQFTIPIDGLLNVLAANLFHSTPTIVLRIYSRLLLKHSACQTTPTRRNTSCDLKNKV